MLGNLRISGDIRPDPALLSTVNLKGAAKLNCNLSPNSLETGTKFFKKVVDGRQYTSAESRTSSRLSHFAFVIGFGLGDANALTEPYSQTCLVYVPNESSTGLSLMPGTVSG